VEDLLKGKTTFDGLDQPKSRNFIYDLAMGKTYINQDSEETRLIMSHAGEEHTLQVRQMCKMS
jgi:hypothetical protein